MKKIIKILRIIKVLNLKINLKVGEPGFEPGNTGGFKNSGAGQY